ncbi:MAG: hypothetical protein ACK4J2_03340 [Sulfurihydrogenibium azorense]|uniref:hypothetical protein n=1 Tax=Sulfurihydrogenibium azorense TaxID=309806 RepID=UPI00391DEC1F
MKKSLAVLALMGAVGFSQAAVVENPILKKLVEKGILTEQEAAAIDEQLAQEEAEKAKYQAEIDKTAMEAKEKLSKLEKKWGDMPALAGKFKKFEIGGKAYIGYTYTVDKKQYTGNNDRGDFEVRRFYFDTKAYLNDKDHIRFTTDLSAGTDYKLKIKYGYLYKDISGLIPHTGFEFGVAHTPWIDFEEHTGWWYRSIDKTFIESSNGMGLWPSADLGINFKTKTPYVSSEIGMFNGEGYDKIEPSSTNSSGIHNSFEGRITFHALGNGDKKVNPTKDQYANVSLHLASNIGYNDAYLTHKNLNLYHIHAVYNHPMFLIAAQYGKVDYNTQSANAGDGYSVNLEVRPVKDWSIFGRYDYWKPKNKQGTTTAYWDKRRAYYVGVAYTMNKYVKWIINYENFDYSGKDDLNNKSKSSSYFDKTQYKLTAELSW